MDDDPLLLDTLREDQVNFGFRVASCQGGAQALEQSERQKPDVAVVDLRMPGMRGVKLAPALRSRRPGSQVVFMGGFMDVPPEGLQA